MRHITCLHCGDTYPDFDVAHVCNKGPYAPQLKYKMNERIRLLAEQVYGTQATEQEIKFAELIVRECMNLVKDCYAESGRSLYQSVCASTIIEEHFGVEE